MQLLLNVLGRGEGHHTAKHVLHKVSRMGGNEPQQQDQQNVAQGSAHLVLGRLGFAWAWSESGQHT